MLKVAWLGPYPVESLAPELPLVRDVHSHSCSWIVNLSNELSGRDDIELHMITSSAGVAKTESVLKRNIRFHVVRHTFPFTRRGFPGYLPLDTLLGYPALRRSINRVISAIRPDILHVYGTEHAYGLAAQDSDIPALLSMQGIISLILQEKPTLFYRLQAPLEKRVVRNAKFIESRTDWGQNFVRSLNPSAKLYSIPRAINPEFFRERERREGRSLLFVGGIDSRKGIEEAIGALAVAAGKYPDLLLNVVGGGDQEYLMLLKEKTRQLGVEKNIAWLGTKTAREIAELHAGTLIFIHPSHIDNSPNSVAEAMCTGLPIVASNVGGIPSMIEDGVDGLLVEPRNPALLAEKILLLLDNAELRKDLASTAKKRAYERHNPARVADRTIDVYKEILHIQRKL